MPANDALPPIPAKRYFSISEVAQLCNVKPYVLRYWEQEFTRQLHPNKRSGNRRFYQHHEVLMVRRIRELLYEQGLSISDARSHLQESQRRRTPRSTASAASAPAAALPAWAEYLLAELRGIRTLLTVPA
ncbi:MAG: MerR family transcriptional regulator [Ottowia sp.]|nr:MerR family transcriptional regulator [Ottowia sp.]